MLLPDRTTFVFAIMDLKTVIFQKVKMLQADILNGKPRVKKWLAPPLPEQKWQQPNETICLNTRLNKSVSPLKRFFLNDCKKVKIRQDAISVTFSGKIPALSTELKIVDLYKIEYFRISLLHEGTLNSRSPDFLFKQIEWLNLEYVIRYALLLWLFKEIKTNLAVHMYKTHKL